MKPERRLAEEELSAEQAPRPGPAAPGATVVTLPRPRSLHVVYNPTAGRRRRAMFNRTLRTLALSGCSVAVSETAGPGEATELAARAHKCDALVVAGGDGTINEALNGLSRHAGGRPALGIIPLGTANVLAHEIGVRARSDSAARALAYGEMHPVYLGRIAHTSGTRDFIMMAGVGFDARVVASVGKRLKKWTGKFAYVWRMLVELARYRPATYRVVLDGKLYRAASVVVANGRYYGGRFVLAPEARLEEPGFQVCLFERPGRRNVIRYALCMALGLLGRLSDYRVITASEVLIEGPDGDPVQADGDLVARLPVAIRVAPGTQRVLYPPAD